MKRRSICRRAGLLHAAIALLVAHAVPAAEPQVRADPGHAYFARERASKTVHVVADWVVGARDNQGLPFVVVDKQNARVFVFDPAGRIRGAAAALLGLARGDDSVPGIGEREIADIRPEERTTPAGRFVAELGMNYSGKDVLWVDYGTAISLHRVITNRPEERRVARLASPTSADNRISYGCINVPPRFFEAVVRRAFEGTKGIVYVLPETRPAREVFGLQRAAAPEDAHSTTASAAGSLPGE